MKIKIDNQATRAEETIREPGKLYSYSIDELGNPVYKELPAGETVSRQQDEIRHRNSLLDQTIRPSLEDKINYLMDKFYIIESDIIDFMRRH